MTPVLTEIRSLLGAIAARSDETERLRRVPADLLDGLTATGALRLHAPAAFGGVDADLVAGMRVLEALATADASVAWSLASSWEGAAMLARLPENTLRAVYSAGPDFAVGWSPALKGTARRVADGYRVSGAWSALGGLGTPTWIAAMAGVINDFGLSRLDGGGPVAVGIVFPAEAARSVAGYQVAGLRGTGARIARLDDAFVPAERAFAVLPAGRPCHGEVATAPTILTTPALARYSCHAGAVALGIAQGALNDLATGLGRGLADTSRAGSTVATSLRHANTALHRARAAMYDLAQLMSGRGAVATATDAEAARTTGSWVVATAGVIVSSAFEVGATSPGPAASTLARRFRDVHTLAQCVALGQDQLTDLTRAAEIAGGPTLDGDLDLDLVPA